MKYRVTKIVSDMNKSQKDTLRITRRKSQIWVEIEGQRHKKHKVSRKREARRIKDSQLVERER